MAFYYKNLANEKWNDKEGNKKITDPTTYTMFFGGGENGVFVSIPAMKW